MSSCVYAHVCPCSWWVSWGSPPRPGLGYQTPPQQPAVRHEADGSNDTWYPRGTWLDSGVGVVGGVGGVGGMHRTAYGENTVKWFIYFWHEIKICRSSQQFCGCSDVATSVTTVPTGPTALMMFKVVSQNLTPTSPLVVLPFIQNNVNMPLNYFISTL